jgi:hypothetical protein
LIFIKRFEKFTIIIGTEIIIVIIIKIIAMRISFGIIGPFSYNNSLEKNLPSGM